MFPFFLSFFLNSRQQQTQEQSVLRGRSSKTPQLLFPSLSAEKKKSRRRRDYHWRFWRKWSFFPLFYSRRFRIAGLKQQNRRFFSSFNPKTTPKSIAAAKISRSTTRIGERENKKEKLKRIEEERMFSHQTFHFLEMLMFSSWLADTNESSDSYRVLRFLQSLKPEDKNAFSARKRRFINSRILPFIIRFLQQVKDKSLRNKNRFANLVRTTDLSMESPPPSPF